MAAFGPCSPSPCTLACSVATCTCAVTFSYIWPVVMHFHPLPWREHSPWKAFPLTLCPIFSVRPCLSSAHVAPSPCFPLILTSFIIVSVHLITFLARHQLFKVRILHWILRGFSSAWHLKSAEFRFVRGKWSEHYMFPGKHRF